MEPFNERFEGPEKKFVVQFHEKALKQPLRTIAKDVWKDVLKAAICEIISVQENEEFIAYMLSESSFFVYDDFVLLKTCGTTTPLLALPGILDIANPNWKDLPIDDFVEFFGYQRFDYLFPKEQPFPHRNFEEEVGYMIKFFSNGEAVTLGTNKTSQFHTFSWGAKNLKDTIRVTEFVLLDLTPQTAALFCAEKEEQASLLMKKVWQAIFGDDLEGVKIDEICFDPVGYSANVLKGGDYATVHVTPQPCCSYVSIETSAVMTQEQIGAVHEALKPFKANDFRVAEACFGKLVDLPGLPQEGDDRELVLDVRQEGSYTSFAYNQFRAPFSEGFEAPKVDASISTPETDKPEICVSSEAVAAAGG